MVKYIQYFNINPETSGVVKIGVSPRIQKILNIRGD